MPDSFAGFCSLWPGADTGGYWVRGMHPPTSYFQKCFDVYDFSIISNLFDSYKPCVLSTRNLIENVGTKCIIFGDALRIRVKKFQQNLPENYSKALK